METLTFYKYQGTGNDFILIDNRAGHIELSKPQIAYWCHRRFGIGADGLMLLNTKAGYDFEMKYYNADGGETSMCGNGGRCLVQFAHDLGVIPQTKDGDYLFLAIDGDHKGRVLENGEVELKMIDVTGIAEDAEGKIVQTGSPHLIKKVEDVQSIDVYQEGKKIRYNSTFKAEGINVNFVQEKSKGNLFVRTYERGVENETYSCGTGVTAAALEAAGTVEGEKIMQIETLGGKLVVKFEQTGPQQFENIWLCGPAKRVFKGEISL